MDAMNMVRGDLIEQFLARSRELLSGVATWGMNLLGRSQDVSWDATSRFMSDYVLLPLVVLLVLLIVVKRALGD